ncbi:MAG: DNA methylase [Pseudomonadota bacterium]|nr:DNA methylase [Pseudomonadota bacterium]
MNQTGVRTEKVWFNFTPDRAHLARYAGRNHTHRHTIERSVESRARRYAAMLSAERLAVLAVLMAIEGGE